MRIEVNVANAGDAQRIIAGKMALATRAKMARAGRQMAVIAARKMEQRFDTARPGNRRRHPGTRRAVNSLDYELDGTQFPITLRYRVLGGEEVQKRIIFLNWGTTGHRIEPNGNAGGNGRVLAWPGAEVETEGVRPFSRGHWHPGSRKGVGFLEEAMVEAIRNELQ